MVLMRIEMANYGQIPVFLDRISFNLYLGDNYILSNPESRSDFNLRPGKTLNLSYEIPITRHFSEILKHSIMKGEGEWLIRGTALLRPSGSEIVFPLPITLTRRLEGPWPHRT